MPIISQRDRPYSRKVLVCVNFRDIFKLFPVLTGKFELDQCRAKCAEVEAIEIEMAEREALRQRLHRCVVPLHCAVALWVLIGSTVPLWSSDDIEIV